MKKPEEVAAAKQVKSWLKEREWRVRVDGGSGSGSGSGPEVGVGSGGGGEEVGEEVGIGEEIGRAHV